MAFRPAARAAQLSEDDFLALSELIHERYGLFFDERQREAFAGRLASRLEALGLDGFAAYVERLRGQGGDNELALAISRLTNNETYFFREAAQLEALSSGLLQARADAARGERRPLRLISAGCSTGEEAYTLAMILRDAGLVPPRCDAQVVGLEVDGEALALARRAVYRAHSFRGRPAHELERHLEPEGPHAWRVAEAVRRLVSFREGNILDAHCYAELRPADVVACRNVLVYFSARALENALELFLGVLAPGGYLLLGHAENVACSSAELEPLRLPGTLLWRRLPGSAR